MSNGYNHLHFPKAATVDICSEDYSTTKEQNLIHNRYLTKQYKLTIQDINKDAETWWSLSNRYISIIRNTVGTIINISILKSTSYWNLKKPLHTTYIAVRNTQQYRLRILDTPWLLPLMTVRENMAILKYCKTFYVSKKQCDV